MNYRLIILISVLLLELPTAAIFSSDYKSFDSSFYVPPQINNKDLNNKVNFSFHDSDLSDVLLMLSKIGKFNVVLPDKYNRKITVTLTNQRVVDAINDIEELTGLGFVFKSNSLIVSGKDSQGLKFESVPVVYYQAEKIVKSLNDVLFKQLAITQSSDSIKPHAALDPTKNSVILTASEEQIRAAKLYIQELDKPPLVKIYTPSFISLKEAKKLIKAKLNKFNSIDIKRFEKNSFIVKGLIEEVKQALGLIQRHDTIPDPVDLVVELYTITTGDADIFKAQNTFIDEAKLQNIKPEIASSEQYKKLFRFSTLASEKRITLIKNQKHKIWGLDIEAEGSLIDKDKYDLSFMGDSLSGVALEDQVVRIISDKELRFHKDLKKITNQNQGSMVVVIIGANESKANLNLAI